MRMQPREFMGWMAYLKSLEAAQADVPQTPDEMIAAGLAAKASTGLDELTRKRTRRGG